MTNENFAIRFGLGAIKAVGFGMMEEVVKERKENGNFKDIYDFAGRIDPRNINKKSVEALAKAGAFDAIKQNFNRRQIAESFDIISAYSAQKRDESSSNQMNLFALDEKPELKKVSDWSKEERLQKEFEAFGYFLNEHPLDDSIDDLKKRGVIFSDKLERDELQDGDLVKMAGVVAASKHRSGSKGRFAYLNISDPFGIFEVTIFDEALITNARDIIIDGGLVMIECLIRKDEGGSRIMVKDVKKLAEFINNTKAKNEPFEDIKKQFSRSNNNRNQSNQTAPKQQNQALPPVKLEKNVFAKVEVLLKDSDPILSLKSFLSQKLADDSITKHTKVYLTVMSQSKVTKIELPQKYLIDSIDITMIKRIEKIIDVEVS